VSRSVGLDIGSTATKAALLEGGRVVRTWIGPSMPDMAAAAARAIAEVGADGAPVLTTGYGRQLYSARIADVSEVTALAAGVEHVLPGTVTVVDIGGQDSKAARVGGGRVLDFAMNDRCAAGTGRFLEAMSRVLHIPIEQFDEVAAGAGAPVGITSTCTVFAETEVVGLMARGTPVPAVLKGLFASIADRVAGLARMVGVDAPIAGTGGALRTRALAGALSQALGAPVVVPPDPQTVTAIGAAILCVRRVDGGR
jgi:predicted CoA-substrate-specific enzyme activase